MMSSVLRSVLPALLPVLLIALFALPPSAEAQTRDPTGGTSTGGTSTGGTSTGGTGTGTTRDPTGGSSSSGSAAGRDDDRAAPTVRRNADAARARGRRFEFVTSGPIGQANAATTALVQAGAQLIRSRSLPNLGRQVSLLDLQSVSLPQARAILSATAPQTAIDLHSFYRYAQGKPRLFAPQMLGLQDAGRCRVKALRIGVIDGPLALDHPALAAASVTQHSVLLAGERHDKADHGTAVAALIVGEDPAGPLAGFSPGARLFAVAAFAKEKRGAAADVERVAVALDWLIGQRVRLINMSFAGPVNEAMGDLMQQAARKGSVLIAAAGNGSSSTALYPAAHPNVIAVTAVDAAGRRYRKANRGSHIEFAAPGVDLYVAKRRKGSYASGTSFAAPIVTALAAQAMARGASGAKAIRQSLRRKSKDLGENGRDVNYGWGLVQAPDC